MNTPESALLPCVLSNSQYRPNQNIRDQNQHEESIDSDEKDFKSLEDVVISGDLLWKVIYSLDSNFFRATRPSSISGAMSEAWICNTSLTRLSDPKDQEPTHLGSDSFDGRSPARGKDLIMSDHQQESNSTDGTFPTSASSRHTDSEIDKTAQITSNRDVEEQNRGLRDQLDEVRHEIERARKLENVIEKYKKMLNESTNLRRQHKDEYRKVATFKPLMEQYRSQIVTLESQLFSQKQETDRLHYELDSITVKLRETEEERDREVEEVALYEERVKELEEENSRAEATIALRQLLNDTVIELENLKTLHTEYVELTFAKSDRESTLLLFSKKSDVFLTMGKNNNVEDLEQSLRLEINNLKEIVARLKNQSAELEARYEKEFRLMGLALFEFKEGRAECSYGSLCGHFWAQILQYRNSKLVSKTLEQHCNFDREELREHSDARLRVFYVEELNAQGHLLLIGVSSSGKMNGTNVFQTKIHSKYTADDFDGDLRTILRQAGTGLYIIILSIISRERKRAKIQSTAGYTEGMDFMFQRVNQHYKDIITPAPGTGMPSDSSGNERHTVLHMSIVGATILHLS
ncbi:hypothetical protein PPACK8108_LOCUS16860 [Phakopsora pachyrhizi]|uniref:Uncharacterized protein n=1 Tax=Phakopsora pachyrhizi TaxID=170000 RepID=A0AAV0B9Z7_PHAPC|nr:hypothetical protein PPACK8108_LOCUS16860 [Phakopsora pachyrhizi]